MIIYSPLTRIWLNLGSIRYPMKQKSMGEYDFIEKSLLIRIHSPVSLSIELGGFRRKVYFLFSSRRIYDYLGFSRLQWQYRFIDIDLADV